MITILIADDHPIMRTGIRNLLEGAQEMKVVGEAQDGDEARLLVAELHPQVLLLDFNMPGTSAAELEKWVRSEHPGTVTLVLTAHDRDTYLAEMVEAGVSGYLDKSVHGAQLTQAIRRAVEGEVLFSNEQLDRVRRWRERDGARWDRLTGREREIIGLLADGSGNARIATALTISQKTVAFHVTNILAKLGVGSRQEAVAWFNKNIRGDLQARSQ
jgi:DNA-binding NarL/FixJ family response regulator